MKATEISLILCEMEAGEITRLEALDKLCVLFNVASQSEQLVCDIFQMISSTSSATKCKCSKEKWEHSKLRN